MRLNWLQFHYSEIDGYARFGMAFIRALGRLGVSVTPLHIQQLEMPGWTQRLAGLDFSHLTIACLPPHNLKGLAGRQWIFTMCEGTEIQKDWAEHINAKAERLIVPCEHNAEAFRRGGVDTPIHVVPGGTDPAEFPILARRNGGHPYTFLALGDRGRRKGWDVVYRAFFKAFGDLPDVRLVFKARPVGADLIALMAGAARKDPRLSFWREDVERPADVYAQADCFAIPSRSEGWGMPHREAAMMGLPVIATRYSGTADGIDDWAIPVETYRLKPVPRSALHVFGEWAEPDEDEVAARMRWCYDHPDEAWQKGQAAAQWLREHQTWDHAAARLLALLETYG
jgi:glycosyltransferase involved in cell wall biosynthesis